MGDLTVNKFLGSLLAVALGLFGLHELANAIYAPPASHETGHGHEGEEKSMKERLAERYAYYVDVEVSGATGDEAEPVFDLGLALANADPSRGERAFKGKCATCHTIEQGGANGTGPNLHAIVGAAKAEDAGFSYSSALSEMDGAWSYDNLNAWLENPSSYARGTSMAFAGLRRDDERANVIAYLAEYTPDAPAFPEPLPAEDEETAEGDAAADGEGSDGETPATSDDVAPAESEPASTDSESGDGAMADAVEEAAESPQETVESAQAAGSDAMEAAGDGAEEVTEDGAEAANGEDTTPN